MNVFKLFTPTLIFLSISTSLNASNFWNNDLNENLTQITKRKGIDNFSSSLITKPWAGIGPNGESAGTAHLYYSRIPAMAITDDNKMVVMFDLRWNKATDQDRIDPGIAISTDGGYTWNKKTAWSFNKSDNPLRRSMDSTILYNNIDGSLYVMHGTWSAGNRNWYADRNNYFNNGIWATTIYKSTDGGLTWNKNAEFSKTSNLEVFSKVKRANQPAISFLGGVGSGIVMRDGTLVFPIQTAHPNGIATTIMYSKDNGKTWDMPEINNALAPNQISLENMVFEIGNKLVMTGRENRIGRSNAGQRWAYYSEDLGKTWHNYAPATFGSSTAQPTQGSSIYVTLPNGRRVLLVSKPNGNNDNWSRGNIALWMLDAKDPHHIHQVTIIRPGSGNPAGAGYSSLAYKEGNLFVAFEDDGDIRVKNLTKYMENIQAKALEWNLPDEIETEVTKINILPHLTQGQKNELINKIRRANDYAIAQSIAINQAMGELKENSKILNEEAKKLVKGLPSRQEMFTNTLKKIQEITQSTALIYLDYNGILRLNQELNVNFLALSEEKLNFSPYIKKVEILREYNTDVLYHNFDNVFAHYESGTKHNSLSIGINKSLTNHLQTGIFLEYSNKNKKDYQVGSRIKYNNGPHIISSFIRYRDINYYDFLEHNRNIDGYINYAYKFQLDHKFSISPSTGIYLSYSPETQIDKDVSMNKHNIYAVDLGVNISYKLNDNFYFNIRPNIAYVKDTMTLSQSNDKSNICQLRNNNLVYSILANIEKHFMNGLSLGSTLKLQKYGSKFSENNLGINISYNW